MNCLSQSQVKNFLSYMLNGFRISSFEKSSSSEGREIGLVIFFSSVFVELFGLVCLVFSSTDDLFGVMCGASL